MQFLKDTLLILYIIFIMPVLALFVLLLITALCGLLFLSSIAVGAALGHVIGLLIAKIIIF
jgi:hypothetical protein